MLYSCCTKNIHHETLDTPPDGQTTLSISPIGARAASLSSAGNVMIRYSAVNWLISCLLTCDNTARTLLARTADVDSQRKNRQLLGHEFIEHTCPPASRVARYWHEALRRGDNDEDGIIIIGCWHGMAPNRAKKSQHSWLGSLSLGFAFAHRRAGCCCCCWW